MNSTEYTSIQSQDHMKPGPDLFIEDLLSRKKNTRKTKMPKYMLCN